jgi:hypothetical protein
MAVCAHEHTLRDFGGQCLETPSVGTADVKSLFRRLDVMKRQSMHRSAIAADPAGSAAYRDQSAFECVALLRRAAVRAAAVASGSRMTLAAVIDEPTTADPTGLQRSGRGSCGRPWAAPTLRRRLLELDVAIRTNQHALVELGAQRRPAARVAAGDGEPLLRWIEVMEIQGLETPVVAAQATPTALVPDHSALELDSIDGAVRATGVALQQGVPTSRVIDVTPTASHTSACSWLSRQHPQITEGGGRTGSLDFPDATCLNRCGGRVRVGTRT